MAASSASQDELQQEAEAHLRRLLDESGEFPDLPGLDQLGPDQIESLGGGVDATYLVKRPAGDVVVKLNSEGLEAEARALRAWKPHTKRVPEVLGLGPVLQSGDPQSGDPPIKYLILAALKTTTAMSWRPQMTFSNARPVALGSLDERSESSCIASIKR